MAGKTIVADGGQSVEFFAARHYPRGVLPENQARIVAVDVLRNEFSAPLKRPHDPIIVPLSVPELAPAHPSSEQIKSPRVENPNNSESVILRVARP